MNTFSTTRFALLCGASLIAGAVPTSAWAQEEPAPGTAEAPPTEPEIVVVGTQIQGAKINDVLPVTVLDEQAIENTGAASGDELFRAIPQAGTVAFNEQNADTANNGRGDVGSI